VASVERFRNDLRDRGYAYRTINTILRIMSAIFRLGIKRGQCMKNPLDSVERAAQMAKELKVAQSPVDTGNDAPDSDGVLSPLEIQSLLVSARPGFERTLCETAYLTGARQGELLGMRWTDLELPKEGSGKMVPLMDAAQRRSNSPAILPPRRPRRAVVRYRFLHYWSRT